MDDVSSDLPHWTGQITEDKKVKNQILINELCQSAGDEQSSLIRIWYYFLIPLLFDLSNEVELSKVGPVSPITVLQ